MTNLARAAAEQMGQSVNLHYCIKSMRFIHIFVKKSALQLIYLMGPSIHVDYCSRVGI